MLTGPHVTGDPEAGDRAAGDRVDGEQASLAARLGWDVANQELFAQALAHRSWCAEHPGREPNERLEFLGDAVLGLVVTDYLYRTYPDLPEGELAKARAAVVNSVSLASTARELQLGNALFLGKGEDASGGRSKLSILADAMEALIGAIYLDAGYSTVNGIVLQLLGERLRESAKGPGDEDYKTRLQELCAQTYDELPVYRVADSGPDHAKVFHAEVTVRGRSLGKGAGRSKKQAEQVAARYAWFTLKAGPGPSAAGTEPAGTEPAGTERVATEAAGTEPVGTGPAGTEPAGTEPAEASPSAAG